MSSNNPNADEDISNPNYEGIEDAPEEINEEEAEADIRVTEANFENEGEEEFEATGDERNFDQDGYYDIRDDQERQQMGEGYGEEEYIGDEFRVGEGEEEELGYDEMDYGEDNQDDMDEDIQNLNYEVYDPDEDDDFPEYANDANKELNKNIKGEKRTNKVIDSKIEDLGERLGIMREHFKNIKQELNNTQALIDVKNKETETEKHLSMVAERQIGRVSKELKKCDQEGIENQDRLNDIQQQIFKGNEKLDKLKLEINWNQEEMEQWALAAKQKEEDNLTLEKYKRADEMKIKDLNLQLEKLTIEKNKRENELEKEITQTQAFQIEIDKTAAEFKKQHHERHRIYSQWDEAIQQIAQRHEATLRAGEEMAKIKVEIKKIQSLLDERKRKLEEKRDKNKKIEDDTQKIERDITGLKATNKMFREQDNELNAEVKILQNRLSAFSSELSQKRNKCEMLQKELLARKTRLTNAEKKFRAQSNVLSNEKMLDKTLKEYNDQAKATFEDKKQELKLKDKEIRQKKDEYFKSQQKLFKLREKEADLYSEIQGTMAALRNLQSHINKLHQELARQQELLYNAEYQIQLLERKVARANGEMSNKESEYLEEETKKIQTKRDGIQNQHNVLVDAVSQLEDEKRHLERVIKDKEEERKKHVTLIEKFNLENDMTLLELKKIVKHKEDRMVQHDIIKLEIKKIRDRLNDAQNEVLQLENKKNQLELSMTEREKEISVHRGVLTAEFKAAEKERHKTAVELAERKSKVRNLKIKYESLIQRKQGSEATNVHEHSQAYYIIKAAQEKEELQRKEDELKAKILKSEKELTSLVNTLTHLNTRNSNYRDYFINKGATQMDVELQNNLEEQCKVASDNLMKKRKEFDRLKREIEENTQLFNEVQNKLEILYSQKQQAYEQGSKIEEVIEKQAPKMERAQKFYEKCLRQVQTQNIDNIEGSTQVVQANLDQQRNLSKTFFKVIHSVYQDYPEVSNIMEMYFKEEGVELPQQPPSSIGLDSESRGSRMSRSSRVSEAGSQRSSNRGSQRGSQRGSRKSSARKSNGSFRISRKSSSKYSKSRSNASSRRSSKQIPVPE